MKYFLPDSQDLVDPSFDFATETRSESRVRQRDDIYAHELFGKAPYDGVLVSKAIVDGSGGGLGRYTIAQRHRLLRIGVREFFRLDREEFSHVATMGDCGAFSYVREERPPFSVREVIEFYVDCGFDLGVSVDHVILGFKPGYDESLPGVDAVPPDWRARQQITLELAAEFLSEHRREKLGFTPIGVAQGWSPSSYADAVRQLQRIGYRYIALGGLVPLKTDEIVETIKAVDTARARTTRLHLFGITRLEKFRVFQKHGVHSFDSTSPLRQAFKDNRDNYYAPGRTYTAVRVPQVEANPKIKRAIVAGKLDQDRIRDLEQRCLESLHEYEAGRTSLPVVLDVLQRYQELHTPNRDNREAYREVLADRPWTECPCEVCKSLGIHVVVFRGAERNRRRGLHNTYVFYERLKKELSSAPNGRNGVRRAPSTTRKLTEGGTACQSPS